MSRLKAGDATCINAVPIDHGNNATKQQTKVNGTLKKTTQKCIAKRKRNDGKEDAKQESTPSNRRNRRNRRNLCQTTNVLSLSLVVGRCPLSFALE